jgi:hypothetical protein
MPSGRRTREGSRQPEGRPLRRKLDARLDVLLDIGESRVARLRRAEMKALREIAREARGKFGRERDPERRRALEREAAEAARRALFAPFTAGIRLPDERRGLPRDLRGSTQTLLSVFVQSKLAAEDLARLGIRVVSRSGELCTAWVPWSALRAGGAIESEPAIRSIELARALLPSLERAMTFTHLDTLHGAGAHKGQGILIGIPDRYIDIHHPDFAATSGGYPAGTPASTRILHLWDQELAADTTLGERDPAGRSSSTSMLDYGVEYDQAEIEATIDNAAAAFSPVRHAPPLSPSDHQRHGTQAAGCALGNGAWSKSLGLASLREGAAPLAQLVFVHLPDETGLTHAAEVDPDFPSLGIVTSTAVLQACDFIFARAEEAGLPCVLSLSRNDALGAHDGSSMLEQHMDALLDRPGRALVVSAGNENTESTHATDTITAVGNSSVLQWFIPQDSQTVEVQVWCSPGDTFDASVTYSDLGGDPPARITSPAPNIEPTPANAGGMQLRVLASTPAPNGDNLITVILLPDGSKAVQGGDCQLKLTATALGAGASAGVYQAWLSGPNATFRNPQFGEQTIAPPATASRAIAVGAHDLSGPPPALDGASGRGPQRDGRSRPDLCGPTGVMAPAPGTRAAASAPPPLYMSFGGTSAAAPIVAGAAAIVMECSGGAADWQVVRDTLCKAAADGGLVLDPNAWGAGWLDTTEICNVVLVPARAEVPELQWELADGDLLPVVEIAPHPPGPVWAGQRALALTWNGPEAGLRLRAESPPRGIAELQIELPLVALDTRFPRALGLHAPSRALGPRETREWLDVEGARAAQVLDGRVRIWADEGAWLVVPRLRLRMQSPLDLVVRVQRRAGSAQEPALEVEQFQRGGRPRRFRLSGAPGA